MSDVAYRRENVVPGNTFSRQYTCKDGSGVPTNLTGYTVRWTGYYGDFKIEKTTADSSLVMPTPTNGTVNLTLTPDETRKIPVNDFMRYELELIGLDGVQTTILYGDIVGIGGQNLD